MTRRELFKTALLGIAISILPKILQPVPMEVAVEITESGFTGLLPQIMGSDYDYDPTGAEYDPKYGIKWSFFK